MIHYSKFDFGALSAPTVKSTKRATYINLPLSFDIETTTINIEVASTQQPRAFMYIWQFGINGTAVYGRTWNEFKDFLRLLRSALHVTPTHKAVIYVHNLSFEFAFVAPYLKIKEVFARAPHHPIYFETVEGFVFKCSYFLTGKSLAMLSRETPTKKLVGDLDYSKIRHSLTPLTPEEMAYCENDVIILNEYISKEIERNGDITKIPLTKTGYVRREVAQAFKRWDGWGKYRKKIGACYPDLETFALLNKCFAGGFTHANARHVGLTLHDVASYDIASSYPTQMLKHKYPLGEWHTIEIATREILDKMCDKYACIMQLSFKGLKATTDHSIISRHKCRYISGANIDNGRVHSAESVTLFLTSVDYELLKMFYTFDAVRVEQFKYAHLSYLPRPMFDLILKLYNDKTKLKGAPEGSAEEMLYKLSKEYINSLYGMTVTNPLDDTVIYGGGEWKIERGDAQKLLNKNRVNNNYCLPYAVGVFVTAWGRYELLSTVKKLTDADGYSDVIYCDTDSIKILHPEKHAQIFEDYNACNVAMLQAALDYHGIDRTLISPLGKTLGIFEFECKYNKFKTLGAKRYCFDNGGKFAYTVAGLPKNPAGDKTPLNYMRCVALAQQEVNKIPDVFDVFDFGLHVPAGWSCKLMSVYNTKEWHCIKADYLGTFERVGELHGVALTPTDFTISAAAEFLAFLCAAQKSPDKILPSFGSKRPELKITPLD